LAVRTRIPWREGISPWPLPAARIGLLLVFNDQDEDFPAQCRALFQRHAEFYLDPESLAMTGAALAKTLGLADAGGGHGGRNPHGYRIVPGASLPNWGARTGGMGESGYRSWINPGLYCIKPWLVFSCTAGAGSRT
jgi:hypothetical protein